MAQDRFAFTGAGYYDGAQIKGVAGFAVQINTSKVYSISEVTIGLAPKGSGNISINGMPKDLQADISTGFGYNVFDYKGVKLFGLAEPGLQQTGESSSALFKAGGGLHKMISKNIGIAIFGTWKYAKSEFQYQWKVNPSLALTFRF
jgi:hypothetical protein